TSPTNVDVNENVPVGLIIYTATADDSADVSNGFTFAISGPDASNFGIDQNTGEVRILISPNSDVKNSYQFDITATDADGNASAPHTVLLSINNLDDTPPTITSGTNVAVDENIPANQIVYTATADDSADVSNGVTFAISGTDADSFSIDSTTGAVSILDSPDAEVKDSYQFDIVATDSDGNASTPHSVLLSINNLDDTPPTMTSGTNVAVDENIPANQVVYTATADDSAEVSNGVTFAISGTDADSFSIDSTTGAVSILDSPDAELKSTYNITIVATDNANNASDPLDVTLNINDLNESPTAISPGVANILSGTDTTNGIKIADLETTDPDTGDSFTYSIVNDLDSEHFSLTNNFLSFDAGIVNGLLKSNYEIRLQVTDLGGNVFESTFTLNVTQTNQPPTEITPDTISIDENIDTTGGYDLGLISTVDPDVFETFTYAIIPGMDAIHFTLRGTQLDQLIFDDGSLDHETKSNYSVTIKVTDSQGNELESILSVQIVDVNEVPSSITLSTSTIPENSDAASGLAIGDLQTTDEDFGDTHSYEVTGGLDENKFRLGGVNGTTLILTDLLIDYENQATYQVQITATDSGGAMIQETITINVDDANDAPSGINPTNFFITENQGSDTGVVLGNLTTIDQDTNDAFTYSIIGGIDADSFQIGGLLNNQLIITEANIDFEAKDSYSVVIRSTDASFAHYDSTITVSVVDQNESPIELTPLDFSILENTSATPGIAIGSLSANDPDLNETFIYSIVSGFDSDYFSITGSTLYFTHDSIDYEQKDTYLTSILVQDSGGNQLTELISVNIMDENESPNDLLNTEYQITDNTDAATGRSLGKLNAVDPDANETFSYEILGGINPALFSIGGDNNDELILTAKTLDSATQPLLSVDVKVTDSGGNSYTETIAVNIISFNSAVLPNTFENNTINLTNDATLETTGGETSESELEITSEELIVETSIETVVTPSIGATPEQMDVGMIQAINSITRFDRAPQFTELVQDNYIFGESTTLSSALENASEKVVKTRFSSAEIAASPFESIFSGASLTSLNALQLEVSKDSLFSKSILGTTTIASASITAGYVIWLLRSGVLFSSMVTSLPAWRTFDPLPVLGYLNEVDNEQLEDDSLQTLVINSNRASKADNHEI
ncbi:cadherin repeat domain-containing protein, partial [Mariniblastus sp.]|nr:cadherin repeat domain-containing protein [Mariniblastus sp.]